LSRSSDLVARIALARAHRFLLRARSCAHDLDSLDSREACEDYLNATIAFADSVWEHMKTQLQRSPGFQGWYRDTLGLDRLLQFLRLVRNAILHVEPGSFPRRIGITLIGCVTVATAANTSPEYTSLPFRSWLRAAMAPLHAWMPERRGAAKAKTIPAERADTDYDYLTMRLDTQGSRKLEQFTVANRNWVGATLERPIWDVLAELIERLGQKVTEAEQRFMLR
jgi:hypothetical protein